MNRLPSDLSHREEHRRAARLLIDSSDGRPDGEMFRLVRAAVAAQRRERQRQMRAAAGRDRVLLRIAREFRR